MSTTFNPVQSSEGLKRLIGVTGLTANIINTVIGAGIFVLPAIVGGTLGPPGVLAYLFCGLLITMIMLCFAEVGTRITVTGGAYAYIEAAFGKYPGFLTTNLFIFGASLMATAAVANAVADTLAHLVPVFSNPLFRSGFFIVLFTILTVVNVRGVNAGVTLVKITAVAKLLPIFLLIAIGVTGIQSANLEWHEIPSIADFGKISLVLFFAFQGAENSLSISGEINHPRKVIPRAILVSTIIILAVYLGVQVVAQGVLGNSLGQYKSAPLVEVARRLVGPIGSVVTILGAAVSMFGYLSSDILNMPRVLFRSAKDGVIPIKALARVHPKFASPYVAIISFTALGCFFAITGEFKQLAILSTASVLLIYLGVAMAVIKFRMKPGRDRTAFEIPGGLAVPLLAILAIGWFLSNLQRNEAMAVLIFLAVLTVIYLVIQQVRKRTIG